jgi:hypothetical protein
MWLRPGENTGDCKIRYSVVATKVENGRDKSRTVPYRSCVSSRPFSYLRENTGAGAGAGRDVPGAGAKTGEASPRPYLRYPVLGRDNTGFIPFSIQPG